MRSLLVTAAVVVGTAGQGCGEILEVPVATTAEPTGSTGDAEGPSSTSDPGENTEPPDFDEVSTSSQADDGASSTTGGGPKPESISLCSPSREGTTIPEDGTWAEASVEVSTHEGASMLGLSVRIAHHRVFDLRMELRAPDGTTRLLLDNPACDSPNVEAMFQDNAVQLANEQCLATDVAAIKGPVAALDELDSLLRTPLGGTWTLAVTDTEPDQSHGTLDSMCVVLVLEGA
jgi:subtilisin-like proprotein convertase family protein